jgi:hypothetical protein
VRVWDRARTADEIRSTMRRRVSGAEANLITYYPLDEPNSDNKVAAWDVGAGAFIETKVAQGNAGGLFGSAGIEPTVPSRLPFKVYAGLIRKVMVLTSSVTFDKKNTNDTSISASSKNASSDSGSRVADQQ